MTENREMKYCVCEVETFFDEAFDGNLCKVRKVLQVFNTKEEAEDAELLFNPCIYGDYDTSIRVIAANMLTQTFR